MDAPRCQVLLVYPRFNAPSFWNYRATCEMAGARYPAAPLGLITVAAMLPSAWTLRLIDRNTEELVPSDFEGVDLVMTTAMLPQQGDALDIISMCREHGIPVVIGGPDATSTPEVYEDADFRILGEAELVIDDFILAWSEGQRSGVFEAEKFKADVTRTPIPRFDLLTLKNYLHVGIQFSRGCPFTCEFCDIIELYGRVPRTKTPSQVLLELDALYGLGYRGHVDFVDDNFIGNKKAVKQFLPHLIAWQIKRGYPYEFSTEASVNLADDEQLLTMMREANFFTVFVGIESPDTDTLVAMQKKQNTRRSLTDSIHKIYQAGMFVNAGFIVGFDSEKGSIAQPMIEAVDATSIPVCMVGLLYALPTTQLTRRLEREGRLHQSLGSAPDGDQCTAGLNFETVRPRRDILQDYQAVLERIYAPEAYFERVRHVGRRLNPSATAALAGGLKMLPTHLYRLVRIIWMMSIRHPEWRKPFWKTLADCTRHNPRAIKSVFGLVALYAHLGPFSREVIDQIRKQVAAIDAGVWKSPRLAPVPPPRA
jgi:hypothetical protein